MSVADAPETTAPTRSANASRWVVGVGSDTDATYECSLDGGAYQVDGDAERITALVHLQPRGVTPMPTTVPASAVVSSSITSGPIRPKPSSPVMPAAGLPVKLPSGFIGRLSTPGVALVATMRTSPAPSSRARPCSRCTPSRSPRSSRRSE